MVGSHERRTEWRVGGPQGGGIDRAASLLAHACASAGYQVLGHREYHSNIMGRHSYYDLCIGVDSTLAHGEAPDVLLCLDAETVCRHANAVRAQGCIIYDADDGSVEIARLGFLEEPLKERLRAQLAETDYAATSEGVLSLAAQRGVRVVPVPFAELLGAVTQRTTQARARARRAVNVLGVAISAAILGLPHEHLLRALERAFGSRGDRIELNRAAAKIAFAHAEEWRAALDLSLPTPPPSVADIMWINGTQSVALGKVAAGIGFQAYYPISPATDESTFLEAHGRAPLHDGREAGPVVLQTEDEMAALATACGAALTGARAATSTSGPGFSLMAEGLGWAGMNEVPVVVSLYQRGGPATGMPTRTEQGDLRFAIHAGHGEFPRIVIASGDLEECFYDAARAFDYAERYQLPVIHLLDKTLASTAQTLRPFDTAALKPARGERVPQARPERRPFPRFTLSESGISPRPLLGDAGYAYWTTGVEHNERGRVSEDPTMREQMMEKRARKLISAAADLAAGEKFNVYGDTHAPFTVVTWGSNKGAVLEAVRRLARDGVAARVIHVRLLWPFPAAELTALLRPAAPLIVVECNYSGQFNLLMQEQIGRAADHLVVKYNGRAHTATGLQQAFKQIVAGTSESRIVLRNPYE